MQESQSNVGYQPHTLLDTFSWPQYSSVPADAKLICLFIPGGTLSLKDSTSLRCGVSSLFQMLTRFPKKVENSAVLDNHPDAANSASSRGREYATRIGRTFFSRATPQYYLAQHVKCVRPKGLKSRYTVPSPRSVVAQSSRRISICAFRNLMRSAFWRAIFTSSEGPVLHRHIAEHDVADKPEAYPYPQPDRRPRLEAEGDSLAGGL